MSKNHSMSFQKINFPWEDTLILHMSLLLTDKTAKSQSPLVRQIKYKTVLKT